MHYLFLKCQNPYQLIMKNKELKTMPTGVTTAPSLEYAGRSLKRPFGSAPTFDK